jgi:hypothetical protein
VTSVLEPPANRTAETAPTTVNAETAPPSWATSTQRFVTGEAVHTRTTATEAIALVPNQTGGSCALEFSLDSWDEPTQDGTIWRETPTVWLTTKDTQTTLLGIQIDQAPAVRDVLTDFIEAVKVSGASTGEPVTLSEDEMLTRVKALWVNPEFNEVFEAEMEDDYASRSTAIVTWIAPDDCREIALYRHDRVHSDGSVTRFEELKVSLPKRGEEAEYREALATLYARVFAAGVAEGKRS